MLPIVAPKLGALIRDATGERVCYFDEIYLTLTKPVSPIRHEAVRQFTLDDLPLLEEAGVKGDSFGGLNTLLTDGIVAGALVSGKIVATARTGSISANHADIAVGTDESWRKRGLATAAASTVIHSLQERGLIPVWSVGEDNMASLRVAEKLGFEEVSRLTNVFRGVQL